jgi:hypothetical protein
MSSNTFVFKSFSSEVKVWQGLTKSNIEIYNNHTFTLVFGTLNCFKWKQHEYKFVKLIKIYICYLGQIFIWRVLDESNFEFLNFKTNDPVFESSVLFESHGYTKYITNKDLPTLFMSSLDPRMFYEGLFITFHSISFIT